MPFGFYILKWFILPFYSSLYYKIAAPRKVFCMVSSGFFFTPVGSRPSEDGFCRAGVSTPPCILELQPLCMSCEGVEEFYGVSEAVRVMAASAAWTRGCKD